VTLAPPVSRVVCAPSVCDCNSDLSLLLLCLQQRPPGVRLPAVPVRADGAASARRRVHRNPASGRCGTASSPLS
jgi:hypothetical protein